MNYFELINKCLIELNFKECSSFTDLVKNDHNKIKSIINVINAEVCGFDNWNFLLRKNELFIPAQTSEIYNSVQGRIHSVYIDNIKYEFFNDFEKFMLNRQPSNTFSVFNDKILLPLFDEEKTLEIIYYTSTNAQDADGTDIELMTSETDVSNIPYPFVEPLLVYGTCMRLKGNSENPRFSYWYGMYKEALSRLRAKIGINALETPQINIKRS